MGDSFDGTPVGLKFKPDDFRVLRIGREVLFPQLFPLRGLPSHLRVLGGGWLSR